MALVLVAVAVGSPLGTAAPAAAHIDLVAAEPSQDATVASLDVVRLRFSGPLRPEFATLAVTGADGARVDSGSPAVAGVEISVPVNVTAAGPYTVAYRVLSPDGHPVEGSYAVTYAPPPSSPPPSSPSPSSAAPPTRPPDDLAATPTAVDDDNDGSAPIRVAAGGLLACVAVAGAWLGWRSRVRDDG